MPRERFALIGLAALVVVGLIFTGVSSGISAGQRDAWMQGYTMGRLTAAAGAEGAAAPVVPNAAAYAVPYAVGYQQHGPGFGGFFFLLLGAGALFFFISRMVMMARWRTWAAMQGGQQGWPQGGTPRWSSSGLASRTAAMDAGSLGLRAVGRPVGTGPAGATQQHRHSSPRLRPARRRSSRLPRGRSVGRHVSQNAV